MADYICIIDNADDYIIPEDIDPVNIEYHEIIAAEREVERKNIPYVYYDRNAPILQLLYSTNMVYLVSISSIWRPLCHLMNIFMVYSI